MNDLLAIKLAEEERAQLKAAKTARVKLAREIRKGLLSEATTELFNSFIKCQESCVCDTQPCKFDGWKLCPQCGPKKRTCMVKRCRELREVQESELREEQEGDCVEHEEEGKEGEGGGDWSTGSSDSDVSEAEGGAGEGPSSGEE